MSSPNAPSVAPKQDAPAPLSTHPHTLRGRLVHWGRILLILAVVAAAVWTVRSHWVEVHDTITDMSWRDWVPAFLALPVAIGLSTLSWQLLVDELGERVGFSRGAQIFLVGQLGKYLPGSVWAYVLQMELGRRAGLARARVFTATLFSLAVAVVAALLCGVLAIPSLTEHDASLEPLTWLYVLLPVGLICLHPRILNRLVALAFRILRRPPLDHPVRLGAVAWSLLAAVGSYVAFGVHLWLLAKGSSDDIGPGLLSLCIGAMAVAMISGLFFFILPSGAGVRELVIVTALTPYVGAGTAIALAAVSRVLLTLADLATAAGAAGLGVLERRRHGPLQHDPGIEDDEI